MLERSSVTYSGQISRFEARRVAVLRAHLPLEKPEKGTRFTYTERLRSSLIALISIFLRPMIAKSDRWNDGEAEKWTTARRWRKETAESESQVGRGRVR